MGVFSRVHFALEAGALSRDILSQMRALFFLRRGRIRETCAAAIMKEYLIAEFKSRDITRRERRGNYGLKGCGDIE